MKRSRFSEEQIV
jgi:putative transposase